MLEKAWRTGFLWPLVCATAWILVVALTPTEGSSVSPILLRATGIPTGEDGLNRTVTPTSNYTGVTCLSLLPPRRGSFSVEKGTGVSVGTVLAFWCREGFQLVGSERISCVLQGKTALWSSFPPVCEAIPKPEDRGLRVAVLASVISGIVILAMSVSFIICCLQEHISKDRGERTEGRSSRRRDKHQSCSRSECWLEREEGDWDAFPPPKIYNLSQRLEPHLTLESPLYAGSLTGFENRGYQRSQESLLSAPLPGLYHTESQVYPHVVLQRVPTPTAPTVPSAPSAPVYLHLSTSALTESPSAQPVLPPYPKPPYSSPNSTPQRPWQ